MLNYNTVPFITCNWVYNFTLNSGFDAIITIYSLPSPLIMVFEVSDPRRWNHKNTLFDWETLVGCENGNGITDQESCPESPSWLCHLPPRHAVVGTVLSYASVTYVMKTMDITYVLSVSERNKVWYCMQKMHWNSKKKSTRLSQKVLDRPKLFWSSQTSLETRN